MEKKGIKYVFIGGIDNILLKTVDPLFIGLCDIGNCKVASKTITKNENEKDEWVFARRDGKPSIVSSKRITKEMEDKKDENGKYLYKEINILAHLFSIDSLKLCANIDLPYHLAEKKNDYLNDEGVKIMPKSPNTYKYEQFIFDVFPYFVSMLVIAVERTVHKFDLWNFIINKKLQFFFYKFNIPEPELLIYGRKTVTAGKWTSPAALIINNAVFKLRKVAVCKRNFT